jgi:peroxiredoxin
MDQLQIGQQAPEVTFGKSDGGEVSLAELRRERPVVVAFLRHFG